MLPFNERPQQNEKDNLIAYVSNLLQTARSEGRYDDLEKLERIIQLLQDKKYGLVWEEHIEQAEELMKEQIPVFIEDTSRKIMFDADMPWNFLLEGDNLHSLHLLSKTHKGKIDCIY